MPSRAGWQEVRLGDACSKIGSGATPRGGSGVYLSDGPYTLVRSQNVYNDGFHKEGLAFITEEHAGQLDNVELQQEDVLINITGDSVARACLVDPEVLPGRVNQHVAVVRTKPNVLEARFLRYVLVEPGMQRQLLSWAGAGGTRNALTKGMLESLEFHAPPLSEQRAIAHVLGTLDDKIELNRRMNETLEEMARALFKSWFVDFDPVLAKAEGGDTGLPPHIADLFPDSFGPSELGEIPAGWGVGTVGQEFQLTMGQAPPGSSYNEAGDGLPFFQGRRDFGHRYPSKRVYCTEPSRFASPGDTLVSVRAPVGHINMADQRCCIGRGLAAVRHCSASRSYTYYTMYTLAEDFAEYEAEGTVFGSINRKGFEALGVVVPPPSVVSAFEDRAWPLDERVQGNEQQTQALTELRDALVPKLMSGEMRVGEAEREVEAVG